MQGQCRMRMAMALREDWRPLWLYTLLQALPTAQCCERACACQYTRAHACHRIRAAEHSLATLQWDDLDHRRTFVAQLNGDW